jgi:hypothetical protein
MMFPEVKQSIFNALDKFQRHLEEALHITHQSDALSEMDVIMVRPVGPRVLPDGRRCSWDMTFMDEDLTITVAVDGAGMDLVVANLNDRGFYVPIYKKTGAPQHKVLNASNLGKAFIRVWSPPARPLLH